MSSPPRIVVLGAGLAGLAAARRLQYAAPSAEVTVHEASDRVGGLIRTEVLPDFVIERGPESILTEKPAAMRLVRELGIEHEVVGTVPERRGAYVVHDGRLARVPEGFSLLAPTDLRAFFRSDVVSLPGKLRAALDLVIPGEPHEDESLEQFVVRRFGREVLDRLAQPLASGIYGAHPASLGLAATMPRFLEAERRRGSVIRGLRAAAGHTPAQGARYSLFVNFRRGMQTLTDALAASVSPHVSTGHVVREITRGRAGYRVRFDHGDVQADGVVLALGGPRNAAMLRSLDAQASSLASSVRHGSGAIVTLAYRTERVAHPLDAYGYVTPLVEGRRVHASTFLSRKWPGRAPAGVELMRFFLGNDGDDAVVDLDDDELLRLARAEAGAMLGASGSPELVRVDRWRKAMPRYGVGHLRDVAALEARLVGLPGLALAGNAYRGVGIPDSILSGEKAADEVLRTLRVPTAVAPG